MAIRVRPFVCVVCGQPTVKRVRPDRERTCPACAEARAIRNAIGRSAAATARRSVVRRQRQARIGG